MKFLDPTIDIAFKKVFGDEKHKKILISFLNSILKRSGAELIVDIKINDPNNIPERVIEKHSIVDVRATDQAGNIYIIEVQVVDQKDYFERCQYYSSLAISRQLKPGDIYKKLTPVIFVGVLSFNLLKTEDYISRHALLDIKTYKQELRLLEFNFIELQKFDKELKDLKTIEEKWIYFLKNAGILKDRPEKLEQSEEISMALDLLEQSKWTDKELDAYERFIDALRVSQSVEETALEKGKQKGFSVGWEVGKAEGKAEEKINTAKKLLQLLQHVDINTISEITGLTIEDIKNLKK